jgi:uncharacterized protein (UPF0332 family)
LAEAFDERQIGDYEFTFTITEKEAMELLTEAENFIAAIADYLVKQGYTL